MPMKIEKKKATRAMMLIASGSTACKNEMVSKSISNSFC